MSTTHSIHDRAPSNGCLHFSCSAEVAEDIAIAARRLRENPLNNRALQSLYSICREIGVNAIAVDAPDCEGSIMAVAKLNVRSGMFSFGPSEAKQC